MVTVGAAVATGQVAVFKRFASSGKRLTVLERLPSPERAIFVPRQGFEYPYRQIVEIL